MAKVVVFVNNECVCCDNVERFMVRVGCLTFCIRHFQLEFRLDPEKFDGIIDVDLKGKVYQKWLEWYKKKYLENNAGSSSPV